MTTSSRIISYVLAKSEEEPAGVRATLYRDLSSLVAHGPTATELIRMAAALDEVDRNHQQLVLDFQRKAL